MSLLTQERLNQVSPVLKLEVVEPLFNKYGLNTTNRIAMFLAQCAHESGNFKCKSENLNYSAEGLQKIFKKYFPTPELAAQYARKPEMIASRCYANRMGNGDEASKEGYKFRGRGYIQLTGKNNYTSFANSIGKSLDEAVAYTDTDAGALESALWFWDTNKLNQFADKDDNLTCTKRINGGTHGLDDRNNKYAKYKTIFV